MSAILKIHLPYLDGWRGLAISFLLIGHFLPIKGFDAGNAGVNLFFVLSGLLMGRILFIDQIAISTFYRRRISRIFPVAYFFIAAVVMGYLLFENPIDLTQVIAAATFTNNYVRPPLPPLEMPLGHFWSLCVEEQSYIVLSLIALASRARWVRPIQMIAVATILFVVMAYLYKFVLPPSAHSRMPHFEVSAFGIFVSTLILLVLQNRPMRAIPLVVCPALVAAGLATHWWWFGEIGAMVGGCAFFALAVNLLDRAPQLVQQVFAFAPLRKLGMWSFSIYVWQQLFFRHFIGGWAGIFGIVCSILVGWISFNLLEQPVRRYLNARWGRHGQSKQSTVQSTLV